VSNRWVAPQRSAAAAAIYAAAEADRQVRPERYRLDPEQVTQLAQRDAADRLSFATGWESGLQAYLGSAAEDGRLNAVGTAMVIGSAVGRLRSGLSLDRAARSNGVRRIAPPIVIIGGWRTGTTFLFRLLATDPRLRAPLPAELTAPHRFASLGGEEREELIDSGQAAHHRLHELNPVLQSIHDSGARLPEECVLALGADLRNWGFTSTVRLDSYARWLSGENLAPGYERYARTLGLLDSGDGRRWVLKAPAHTAELPALAAAFPGAVVVHLHRDIVETVSSGASLFAVFRSTYSDDVDGHDVGRFQASQTELWLRRALEFRRSPASTAVRVVDLSYEVLVSDPSRALRSVYAAADLEAPVDIDSWIAAYNASSPRHRHGRHGYRAAEFGLDEGELRERFAFAQAFMA
jgi:hypothetical protein